MDWSPAWNIGAGIIGGLFGRRNAKKQLQAQKDLWTYQQSNAHQLEVEDLRKAGLNPILSAGNSQMASMPSAPSGADVMSPIVGAISNFVIAKEQAKAQKEIAQINANSAKYTADVQADTANKDREVNKSVADSTIKLNSAQITQMDIQNSIMQLDYRDRHNLSEAQVKEIAQNIENSKKVVEAQVNNLNSSSAVNMAQVNKINSENVRILQDIRFTGAVQDGEIDKLNKQNKLLEKLADGDIKAINADKASWNVLTGRAGSEGMTPEEFEALTPQDRIKWLGKAGANITDFAMSLLGKGKAIKKMSGSVLRADL